MTWSDEAPMSPKRILNVAQVYRIVSMFRLSRFLYILGDPGAVSRVDKMFLVKVYCKIETSPWALTLTEPVPEAFELPASDWPEKIFLANQRREAAG